MIDVVTEPGGFSPAKFQIPILRGSKQTPVYEPVTGAMSLRSSVAPEKLELKLGRVWKWARRGEGPGIPGYFDPPITVRVSLGADMLLVPIVPDYAMTHSKVMDAIVYISKHGSLKLPLSVPD
jgi:hypothetical protein